MSDLIEQPDPIWCALHHAHLWSDLNERDQDEPPTGHRATPPEWLLDGRPDLCSGDTIGPKAALTHVFDQLVRLEVILPNARGAVGGYLNGPQAPRAGQCPVDRRRGDRQTWSEPSRDQ